MSMRDLLRVRPRPAGRSLWNGLLWALIVITAVASVAAVTWTVNELVTHPDTPAEGSPAAGFARDMAVHHEQAVEMAELIRMRTQNPEIRMLAVDIVLSQQAQIGRMHGWLDLWGLPVTGTQPPMAWMGMPVKGRMPGMASVDQIARLQQLSGPEADARFLALMIEHHRAGVEMAEAVLERSREPVVRRLAEAIFTAQQSETAAMTELLNAIPERARRGAGAVENGSADAGHHMGGM